MIVFTPHYCYYPNYQQQPLFIGRKYIATIVNRNMLEECVISYQCYYYGRGRQYHYHSEAGVWRLALLTDMQGIYTSSDMHPVLIILLCRLMVYHTHFISSKWGDQSICVLKWINKLTRAYFFRPHLKAYFEFLSPSNIYNQTACLIFYIMN